LVVGDRTGTGLMVISGLFLLVVVNSSLGKAAFPDGNLSEIPKERRTPQIKILAPLNII